MARQLAFVDVDTQFDFIDPTGNLYVPGAEKLIPNLQRLTQWALRHHVPILATMDAHSKDDPEFEHFPPHCVLGTSGQKKISETLGNRVLVIEPERMALWPSFCLQAKLLPYDQFILQKPTLDVFDNANADPFFRKISARRYVVYGVATEYCVLKVVLGLRKRGCPVEVVEDAIAPVSQEAGDAAVEEMKQAGAVFVKTEEVVSTATT